MKENVKLTRYVATKLAKKYPRLKGCKVSIFRTLIGSYRHELLLPKGKRATKSIRLDFETFCNEARDRYGYDKPTKKRVN